MHTATSTHKPGAATPAHSHWTETSTGQFVDLLNPSPDTIKLVDIAGHLSRLPRFSGAEAYSVADHSVWVAEYLYLRTQSARIALQGLFHDAHEAYTGDITTPVKRLPDVNAAIVAMQARLQIAIVVALDLPPDMPSIVEEADQQALAMEVEWLLPSKGNGWDLVEIDQFARGMKPPQRRESTDSFRHFISLHNYLRRTWMSSAA